MGQKRKQGVAQKTAPEEEAEAPAEYEFTLADGIWLRLVKPYRYCFRTFAKARWIGRSLLEVCATEFGANPPEYYREAIISGRIRVDGNVVTPDYVLRNNDAITHETKRHEPPVLARIVGAAVDERGVAENNIGVTTDADVVGDTLMREGDAEVVKPIAVVGKTDELVAVDKPPTMPVHPSGAYHHNTLLHILAHEQPQWRRGTNCSLHTVHRLDRLTSGLILLAQSPAVARRVCGEIADGKVRKEYLARVRGRFPKVTDDTQLPLEWRTASVIRCDSALEVQNAVELPGSDVAAIGTSVAGGLSFATVAWCADGSIRFHCPVRCVSHRDGVHECHPEGKHASTVFAHAGYDDVSGTSLVRCIPLTGRTHQIRVHLRQLGYPIANDPCYGGDLCASASSTSPNGAAATASGADRDETTGSLGSSGTGASESAASSVGSPAPSFTEIQLRCRGIWLHALRYSGPGFSFATDMPPWAEGFAAAERLECSESGKSDSMTKSD